MAEEVRQAAARGYHWIKYHVDEMQDVIAQTEAMQEAAPPYFKIHYDFNANSNYYTMRTILAELVKFRVAGRFEDVVQGTDEDAYRMLREQCPLPIHRPPRPARSHDQALRRWNHGRARSHRQCHQSKPPLPSGSTCPSCTNRPAVLSIQAFLAHEVAVFKMATIDHVNCCHLWQEDVVKDPMPVIDGSVAVPPGPGLGIELEPRPIGKN